MTELSVLIEPTGNELFDKVQGRVLEIQRRLNLLGYTPFFVTIKLREFENGDAGVASLGENIIYINPLYFKNHEEEMLRDTVPHEVVHLYLCEYKGIIADTHGAEFVELCHAIGCDSSEFHTMNQ
jgi:hypothetical protein